MNQTEIKKKQLLLFIRIFGLVSLILLINLIGNLGMLYLACSLEFYFILSTVLLNDVPDYMEKMIRSRMGKEQYKNADKVSKMILSYCLIVGFAISLLLFMLADITASRLLLMKEAAIVLKILSPLFFLNALGAVMQGYFQGMGTAMPSMIYHIVKQLFQLTFSLLFGYILMQYGKNVSALLQKESFSNMYGAVGAAIGLCLGAGLADLFLFIIYIGAVRRARSKKPEGLRLTEDGREVGKQFICSMIPASGHSAIMQLPILMGLLFYVRKPGHDITQYGAFYVQYLVICGIFIYSAFILISGKENALIHLVRREEIKSAKNYLTCGIQALLIFTCFFAAIITALASPLLKILFREQTFTANITTCLEIGASIIVFYPLGQYYTNILIGIGKRRTVLLNSLVAFFINIIVVICSSTLFKNDMTAMVMGLIMFFLINCLLNGFFLFRFLHYRPEWFRGVLIPVGASLLTGICLLLLRKGIHALTSDLLTVIICFLLGCVCYLILIFISKCFREKDYSLIPCGEVVRKLGLVLHLI